MALARPVGLRDGDEPRRQVRFFCLPVDETDATSESRGGVTSVAFGFEGNWEVIAL